MGYSELLGKTNKQNKKILQTKKFLFILKQILKKNIISIKNAKAILKLDNNFEDKIYNIFKDNNFKLLEKNPLRLTKKDLKIIIERIKK